MLEEEFRRMALSLPETSEATHMGHPDFRVAGKDLFYNAAIERINHELIGNSQIDLVVIEPR